MFSLWASTTANERRRQNLLLTEKQADDFWKKEKVHARAPTFQGIKNLDRVTGISLGKYQESRQNESVEVAQMSLSLILDWYLSSNSIMLPFLFSVF